MLQCPPSSETALQRQSPSGRSRVFPFLRGPSLTLASVPETGSNSDSDLLPYDISQSRSQSSLSPHSVYQVDTPNSPGGKSVLNGQYPAIVTSPSETGNKSLLQTLSTREGSITVTDDGKLRYFGPISNRHLMYEGHGWKTTPARLKKFQACEDELRVHGYSSHVDRALRDHLIDIYFTWIDSFFPLIDRSIFLKHMELAETDPENCLFYSPTLLYAIMALASLHTDSDMLGGDIEGNGFAARARILIEQEMESPEVTTAQAFVLMGHREATTGRDSRGWIYTGMSLRIAIDLGLHCDYTPKLESGETTYEEVKVRNLTFWGSYVYDRYVFFVPGAEPHIERKLARLWGLFLGRPTMFDDNDISCPYPRPEPEEWEMPYIPTTISRKMRGEISLRRAMCCHLISLVKQVDQIASLTSGKPNRRPADFASQISKIYLRLLEWLDGLPRSLTCTASRDSVALPHVMLLQSVISSMACFAGKKLELT
jgi:hypothetical protein